MRLQGAGNQQRVDTLYDASGTLAGTTPVTVLPQATSRTILIVQNVGSSTIWVDFGPARAVAAITGGIVTSVTPTNGGQGYTSPPEVRFEGGGNTALNSTYTGTTLPDEMWSPGSVAKGHAVLTGGVVTSIVIDNPGANYACPPFVSIVNRHTDTQGAVAASATPGSGAVQLSAGASMRFDATACPTGPVSIVGSIGGAYAVKYMP